MPEAATGSESGLMTPILIGACDSPGTGSVASATTTRADSTIEQLLIESLLRVRGCGSENSARWLFDDVVLEALHERDHLPLLGLRHLELRQGRRGVAEKHAPVAFADAHTSMAQRHVPAAVVHGSAGARAEEVDQQLLLPIDPVIAAMRPETAELRVAPKARQQIVRHRRDRIVAAASLIQRPLAVAHHPLRELVWTRIVSRATERNRPA